MMIVIASPGRLLDHLKLTTDWLTKNLLVLAVDEADRVLDNGFEEDMREIVSLLPKQRQTFLFSATQTTRVEQLARISFYRPPLLISMKRREEKATVDTLEQGYVMCPSEQRLLVLYHFVKRNLKKKMIVFFSSRNAVSFHCELFNYIDVPCVAFHGKQKQHQRSATYMQFCNAPSGVLFTTDVAARGLDIPHVDWIVQFDPPDDPVKYVHRVGRTARAGRCGNALMFLLPQEKLFLKYLYDDAHVTVSEFTFDLSKVKQGVSEQLEQLVNTNYYLRTSARRAYEGYLLSYSSSQLKNVFDIHSLDLAAVAKGFALSEPPPLKLDLSQSAAHMNKKSRREFCHMKESKDKRRRLVNEQTLKGRKSNISGEW
ncbi:ATP-dependent DEAD/H RNA helicase [Trypanosoma rangeli SC58]|uniref:ATP-dependent RNA helicase n=1 Tax=Trypanosoma rangeli SC58 TaxID=429131 RepID=A0A061JA78_TRYRA|nr:ATP-dependent DEAD/H RNA helicase [Trypanosoma rangeli SC58]